MTWWYLRWAGLAAVRAARRWEGLASVRATCLHYIVSIIFSSLYCVRATCFHLRLLFLVFLEEDKKSWKRESCDCKRKNDPQKSRVGVLDCGGEKFSIGLEVFFWKWPTIKIKTVSTTNFEHYLGTTLSNLRHRNLSQSHFIGCDRGGVESRGKYCDKRLCIWSYD